MLKEHEFEFKKAQIENFISKEFDKKFGHNAKISIRQRTKFIDKIKAKISKNFGKDVLCMLDFNKQGLTSIILPAKTESTDKGKLFQSLVHPRAYYTSHCLDRFSNRMEAKDNCIFILDSLLTDALMTYGEYKGFLVCSEGVFAFEEEKDRLILKTFINYDLLDQKQIERFYSLDGLSSLPSHMIPEDSLNCDIVLSDELPLQEKPSED